MASLLNEPEADARTPRNSPLVLRTILITVSVVAVLLNAAASVYFYDQNEKTAARMKAIQADLEIIRAAVAEKDGATKTSGLEDQLREIDGKLDGLDHRLDEVASEVSSISDDIRSVSDDVSSIQLRIGY